MVGYRTVQWESGFAGLLEIIREAEKLPYRATVSAGKLTAGTAYVRHGTHTSEADPDEFQSLIEEGNHARAT